MLEVLPAWNEVPDLMMEAKDRRMITEAATKQRRDEVAQGRRKWWRDDDIRPEKHEYSPRYLGEHETQQDSIQRIEMNFSKKKMNCRLQINGRGFHRWCFVADV